MGSVRLLLPVRDPPSFSFLHLHSSVSSPQTITVQSPTNNDTLEMTKKQRAKYERKQERLRLSLPQKVPLHEQSIDLTPRDATAQQSLAKRQELTKSQREARRKSIRESNFLKSM